MGVQPKPPVGPSRRPLLQKDIEAAQAHTTSNADAARYLNVSFDTYKKYAKMYGVYEQHKNPGGKGVGRHKMRGAYGLDAILAGEHPTYDKARLKERVIAAGKLKEACGLCGFDKQREFDGRMPLVLHCLDGNEQNLRLENLQLRCYNCFHGDEQFLTKNGIDTFRNTVNTEQLILTSTGKWYPARIVSFGIQDLQIVTLKPSKEIHGRSKSKLRVSIRCTPNHRWLTSNRGEVTNLSVGDIIPFINLPNEELNLEAWIRGFGFGDGTIGSSDRAQIRLCGRKDLEHINKFKAFGHCSISFPPSANGDAVVMFHKGYMSDWKQLPTTTNSSFLQGWLLGYLAADGHRYPNKSGWELCSQNQDAIDFVNSIAGRVGFLVTGLHTSSNIVTNIGQRKSPLYRILLHQEGVFKVTHIEPTSCDEVFCAVEPQTQSFVLASGALTGNCTYLTTGKVTSKPVVTQSLLDDDILATGEINLNDIRAMQVDIQQQLSNEDED